ncbi:MAG: nitroreductase family protein [Candidatus Altiarchaeota archaeon]|nr:nitroreductase family protein [Candidatus Altiarchaeota archaeon]
MDVLEAMVGRRSVRKFIDKPIELDTLADILEAGKWAPTAGNINARSVIIIRDILSRKQMARAASQSFVADAPVVLVICTHQKVAARKYGKRGAYLYVLQDTAAMIQNILLAAYSLGIASCWVGAFNEDYVMRVLKIPPGVRPVALIPIGYPKTIPKAPDKGLDVHIEKW